MVARSDQVLLPTGELSAASRPTSLSTEGGRAEGGRRENRRTVSKTGAPPRRVDCVGVIG
jgi:hypothetical protein